MAPAARRPEPPGRNLPAPYVSPWRLLRQDFLAVLASLRLKLQELWRLNAAGELPRPGFWPQPLAAWFMPLLLGLLLALALAVVGLGLAFSASRPEPSSQAPQSEVIRPTPESSSPPGTSPRGAAPRGTIPQTIRLPTSGSSGPNDAGAPNPGTLDGGPGHGASSDGATSDGRTPGGGSSAGQPMGSGEGRQPGGQRHPQADILGVELGPAPLVDSLKGPAGGREPIATASGSPDWLAPWQAGPPDLDREAPRGAASGDGLAAPPGVGNTGGISPTAAPDRLEASGLLAEPAETLLELLRDATPQAPPQAIQLAERPTSVVLRTAAGFEQASAAARQDWADRWLELVREQGYSQLTLLDPAGRLLGSQARVGSGMILLQPFREPP